MGKENIVIAIMVFLVFIIYIIGFFVSLSIAVAPTELTFKFEMDNNTLEAFKILEKTNTTIVQIYQCDSNCLCDNNTSIKW